MAIWNNNAPADSPSNSEPTRTGFTRRSCLRLGAAVLGSSGLASTTLSGPAGATDGDAGDADEKRRATPDYSAARASDLTFDVRRTLHAVRDLGWDPTGEDPISVPLRSHTEIRVPPGRYLLDRDFRNDALRHFRLVGTGERHDDVTFVTDGEHRWLCRALDTNGPTPPTHVEIANVHFEYGPGRTTAGPGLHLAIRNGVVVRDVEWTGYVPPERHDDFKCYTLLTDPDGTGFVERITAAGPAHIGGHRDGRGMGILSYRHRGTLYVRDARVENMPGDGTWYTAGHGRCVFERCLFRNNAMANVRVGGDSVVRDCVLVQDHDAIETYGGAYNAANGLYVAGQTGDAQGTLVEHCDILMSSLSIPNGQAIRMHTTSGDATVRNTRIAMNAGGPGVTAESTVGPYARPDDAAWHFEDCSIHGDRPMAFAFCMDDRAGSSVVDTTVDLPVDDLCRDSDSVRLEDVRSGPGPRATARDPRAATPGDAPADGTSR